MQTSPILVSGATGHQGGAVAHQLLQRGFTVHALVRDQNKPAAQELLKAGAHLVEGDLDDRDSLDRALRGARGVFSVQAFEGDVEAEIRQGKALADAALAAGVSHFVYSSVGSAERATGIPHFDSKFQIEEHIRSIGLPHTILRPVFFFFNYASMRPMIDGGTLSGPLAADTPLQQISEADYGHMVADVFERPAEFLGRAIEAASVDATMAEIAAALSEVTGHAVAYAPISFDDFESQAGREVTLMYRWFERVGYDADFAELKREFGAPTEFEPYLREHGWADSDSKTPVAAH